MTFTITRRALGASAGAFALAGLNLSADAQAADALQDWLLGSVFPLRAAGADEEDFSDLGFLAGKIGGARVVQLGEPSHNAGACFAAKARLVKFLHRRMGFDVVIWESGMFHVELVDAALREGGDPVAAARLGLIQNWASSAEIRPLFEYARDSHATPRPLTMAGFDMTPTGAVADMAAALRAYFAAPRDPAVRRDATDAVEDAIAAYGAIAAFLEARGAFNSGLGAVAGEERAAAQAAWERDTGAGLRPVRADLDRLERAVARLISLLEDNRDAFAGIEGELRRGFMTRLVASIGGRGANLYERDGSDVPARADADVIRENRRDALNAENLRFLIGEAYADRKVIVWAHNAHVMNAYYLGPDFKRISIEPVANAMKPHGVYLAEWLGDDLYTIGFTAYEGEDGWVGLQAAPIPPASEGSIEERLHRLRLDHAFLDLRVARRQADSPLRTLRTVRVPKFDEVEIEMTVPYDALVFIDTMTRATLIA